MAFEFPYLYRYSAEDAKQRRELELWRDSWNQNINCKYAIEYAISRDAENGHLKDDCARSVLEDYGFKRVQWVLANTIQHGDDGVFTPESTAWAKRVYIPAHREFDGHDGNNFFRVDSSPDLVESFTRQYLDAYQELGMFDSAQCESDTGKQDFNGKVLCCRRTPSRRVIGLRRISSGCVPVASAHVPTPEAAPCLRPVSQTEKRRDGIVRTSSAYLRTSVCRSGHGRS